MSNRVPITVVAKASAVPARTLRRWVAEGRITSERRGREWLIDPIELVQLEDIRERSAGRLPRPA
jgi:excisionase family DNA binding protein